MIVVAWVWNEGFAQPRHRPASNLVRGRQGRLLVVRCTSNVARRSLNECRATRFDTTEPQSCAGPRVSRMLCVGKGANVRAAPVHSVEPQGREPIIHRSGVLI